MAPGEQGQEFPTIHPKQEQQKQQNQDLPLQQHPKEGLWASLHTDHRYGSNCLESHMQSVLADMFFTKSKKQENNVNYVSFSLMP